MIIWKFTPITFETKNVVIHANQSRHNVILQKIEIQFLTSFSYDFYVDSMSMRTIFQNHKQQSQSSIFIFILKLFDNICGFVTYM